MLRKFDHAPKAKLVFKSKANVPTRSYLYKPWKAHICHVAFKIANTVGVIYKSN